MGQPDLAMDAGGYAFLRDFSVTVVDNASTDGVIDYLRQHHPEVVILRNARNLGFARAHNQAIALARARWSKRFHGINHETGDQYVLVTNPDLILESDFLECLVAAADTHPESGSVGGKLLKIVAERAGDVLVAPRQTNIIDSTGLKIGRSRRVVERGAGEEDQGQYSGGRVFGISGALALYRVSALDDVRFDDEYFDDDFFAYKEDIDLAWRLQLRGWQAWYDPRAVAYHYRAAAGSVRRTPLVALRERHKKSAFVNFLSTRNHLLLLWKNDDWSNRFRHLLWIVPYELGRLLLVIFTEPRTFTAYLSALRLLPRMREKRAYSLSIRKISPAEFRTWLCNPTSPSSS